MNNLFLKLNFWISKKISKISSEFIWLMLGIIAAVIIIVPWIGVWIKPLSGFSRFFVDIFSPVSFRNISYESPSGWYSSIAYSIGVIVITGLLIAIVTTYLRTLGDRYKSGTLDHYNWNDHILFLGYDELMLGTLRDLCKLDKKIVVAVPENVEATRSRIKVSLTETEFALIEVIQCNETDRDDLQKKACVGRGSTVFIIGQPDEATHDATNQKCLDILSELIDESNDFTCYIYLRNQATLSLIQRQEFGKDKKGFVWKRTNPFNIYQNIASKLLTGFDSGNQLMTLDYQNDKRNLAVCPQTNVHLAILGMTPMGMALAKETLMVAHYPGRRVKITLVDEKAREEMFYFMGRYKELFKCCKSSFLDLDGKDSLPPKNINDEDDIVDVEFEFIQGSIAHPLLMGRIEDWAKEEEWIFTLAICSNDSPKNMASALYLPRPLLEGEKAIQVWVYQQGDNSLEEYGGHDLYKNLHTFSANEYGANDLQDSIAYLWAEEVAKAYAKATNGNAGTKWNEMSQYERWSSLNNVRSIITKLRGLGYEIVRDGDTFTLWFFGDSERTRCYSLDFSDEIIDALAETEHIRWNADTLAKGYRPTNQDEHDKIVKDKSQKKEYRKKFFAHDDLRKYAALDDDTKSYDIRMTEAVLQAINIQLRS